VSSGAGSESIRFGAAPNAVCIFGKRRKQLSTQKPTSPNGDIDQARKLFERHLLVKGLDFLWDGKRYNTTNIQTKWRYFCLGFFSKEKA
jgi:hypothetical protein